MRRFIIDPSTLPEEQREAIKSEYDFNANVAAQFAKESTNKKCCEMREWHQGKCDELISIFGKELFNGGE